MKNVYIVIHIFTQGFDNDISNLEEHLRGINEIEGYDLYIKQAVRTGDITQYQRSKMLKHLSHIIIITPETSSIILVAPKFREKLKYVRHVIIDEIHSFAENKATVSPPKK